MSHHKVKPYPSGEHGSKVQATLRRRLRQLHNIWHKDTISLTPGGSPFNVASSGCVVAMFAVQPEMSCVSCCSTALQLSYMRCIRRQHSILLNVR